MGQALGSHEVAIGDVIGVATAVVPTVSRPELAELCAAMESVPVGTRDVGRRIDRERRSGQMSDSIGLLRWAPAEDVDAPTVPIGRVGELVSQPVGVPARMAKDEILGITSITRDFGTMMNSASG